MYRRLRLLVVVTWSVAVMTAGCGSADQGHTLAVGDAGGWSQEVGFDDPAPEATVYHSAVYANMANRMIIFGGGRQINSGIVAALSNDLWAYDVAGSSWELLNPAGSRPDARAGQAMVYDSQSGEIIVFGGVGEVSGDTGAGLSDTWAYDIASNTWTDLDPQGPVPPNPAGQSFVYDPSLERSFLLVVNVDGDTGDLTLEVWSYDRSKNSWHPIAAPGKKPTARIDSAVAYDSDRRRILMFGGTTLPPSDSAAQLGDLWAFDTEKGTWTELEPEGDLPPAGWKPGAWYDSRTHRMMLILGWLWDGDTIVETWAYDIDGDKWLKCDCPVGPMGPRVGESIVFDPVSGQAILFGGATGSNSTTASASGGPLSALFDDVWYFAPGGVRDQSKD